MNKKQLRQQSVRELVEAAGFESIEHLADSLKVSGQTIRRDISEMEDAGLLRKTHGGAASRNATSDTVTSTEYVLRKTTSVREKQRAAEIAASQVQDGQSVFLDAGTTCFAVARALAHKRELKVVSYSLSAAMLLKDIEGFSVAVPGGFVRNVEGSLYGEGVSAFLDRFRFDVALLSASGISQDGVVSDDNHWEIEVVTNAMSRSRQKILVVDHSKFERSGHVQLCHINEFDILATDRRPEQGFFGKEITCRVLWE